MAASALLRGRARSWWRLAASACGFVAALAVTLLLWPAVAPAATPQMEAAMEAAGKAPAPKARASRATRTRTAAKKEQAAKAAPATANVYAGQPAVTEKELLAFADLLPQFRAWARAGQEEAHPVVRDGKADFLYSPNAAAWVAAKGWQPARFFCVMGRLAAALVSVEEGNDMGSRPADMPSVSNEELELTRRHLGTLLTAGGDAPPIRQ